MLGHVPIRASLVKKPCTDRKPTEVCLHFCRRGFVNLKRFYGTTDLRQIVRPTMTVFDPLVQEIDMERPLMQGYGYLRATRAGADKSPARADRFPDTKTSRELLENTLQCRGETA